MNTNFLNTSRNWMMKYTDKDNEVLHEIPAFNMTEAEALNYAVAIMPKDRFIDDYHLEPLTE